MCSTFSSPCTGRGVPCNRPGPIVRRPCVGRLAAPVRLRCAGAAQLAHHPRSLHRPRVRPAATTLIGSRRAPSRSSLHERIGRQSSIMCCMSALSAAAVLCLVARFREPPPGPANRSRACLARPLPPTAIELTAHAWPLPGGTMAALVHVRLPVQA